MEIKRSEKGSLARRFLTPPFSVIKAQEWINRKRQWLSLGIKSEIGRSKNLTYSTSCQPIEAYAKKEALEKKRGQKMTWLEFEQIHGARFLQGTSVFDPVLCEAAYRWFCPTGGSILDPFAGGAVRGIVAALCGHPYTGVDIRPEQIAANHAQWDDFAAHFPAAPAPIWRELDARKIEGIAPVDLVFTCPPYADLEVYSNRPDDLSTMRYPAFLSALKTCFNQSLAALKDDRFAIIVISDVRDKKGIYRGLVADTIKMMQSLGASLYNDAIFIPPLGSLPMRAGTMFSKNRKFARAHQHILVFVKGDWKEAVSALSPVTIPAVPKKKD